MVVSTVRGRARRRVEGLRTRHSVMINEIRIIN